MPPPPFFGVYVCVYVPWCDIYSRVIQSHKIKWGLWKKCCVYVLYVLVLIKLGLVLARPRFRIFILFILFVFFVALTPCSVCTGCTRKGRRRRRTPFFPNVVFPSLNPTRKVQDVPWGIYCVRIQLSFRRVWFWRGSPRRSRGVKND